MPERVRKFGGGRYPTKFHYNYQDLAEAIGCSVEAVRKHAQRGNFDPDSLVSILEFIKLKLKDRLDESKSDDKQLMEQIDSIGKR